MILYKVYREPGVRQDEDTRKLLNLMGPGTFSEEQFVGEYQEVFRTRKGMAQEAFSTFVGWDMIYPFKEIHMAKRRTTRRD